MMKARITTATSVAAIERMLEDDGYDPSHARAVKAAYDTGCLLWTDQHLVTTGPTRLDLRPGPRRA